MADFPTSIPSFETAAGAEVLNVLGNGTGLVGMLNGVNGEVVAIATKIGTGSSTPTSNAVFVGTGSGTSGWATTLAGLTLSSPVLNGSLSGDAFLDEDNMASNSASKAASQQSIKAYVDAAITATKEALYPVGSIYINEGDNTNPGTLLGFGTWSAFAAGRVLIGLDSGDTDFDTTGETGGAKTHTHPLSNAGAAKADPNGGDNRTYFDQTTTDAWTADAYQAGTVTGTSSSGITAGLGLTGNTDAANGMPPYITVYMWKRTA